MSAFNKQIGRIRLEVPYLGLGGDENYSHAAELHIPTGWNDSVPVHTNHLSIAELRDLHYAIGEALRQIENWRQYFVSGVARRA